jgi:hypothetical protein
MRFIVVLRYYFVNSISGIRHASDMTQLKRNRQCREFGDGLRIDVKAIVGSFGEASSSAQEVPLSPDKESRWNEK